MEIEFPKATEVLGRIAAQTAKQVIFQKVREAERENIYAEYNQRIGEVRQRRPSSGSRTATSSSRSAASRRCCPRKEQSRAESYAPGDRVRAVIKGVNRSAKGPQIVLSRTDPALLIKLFEQEVPGDLRRHGRDPRRRPRGGRPRQGRGLLARARRRPGRRLRRHEGHARAVDHPRAARREDRHRRVVGGPGRRSSPTRSARPRCSASRSWTTASSVMEVIVEDKQLSLAIGKKGQNVRLAAKLTGWRIDIKSEEEKRREVEAQLGAFELPAEASEGADRSRPPTRPRASSRPRPPTRPRASNRTKWPPAKPPRPPGRRRRPGSRPTRAGAGRHAGGGRRRPRRLRPSRPRTHRQRS